MSIDDIFDIIDNDDYYLKTWQECTTVWPRPRDRRRCTVALPRLHNQDQDDHHHYRQHQCDDADDNIGDDDNYKQYVDENNDGHMTQSQMLQNLECS